MDGHQAYYGSLKRNMVLVIIVVSVTPLVLIAGTILYYFDVSYSERTSEHLRTLVKKHARDVNTFLETRLAATKTLAKSFSFEHLSDSRFLARQLAILRDGYGGSIVDLGVVNEYGVQVAYAGPFSLQKADYRDAEWFKDAIERDWYISDVFLGIRDLPHFIVSARQKVDGHYWLLRSTVDFEAFNSIVENIRLGDTGFAFIINRSGEFQTRSVFGSISSKRIYLDPPAHGQVSGSAVALVSDYNRAGKKLLHFMAPLKDGQWILGYQQDADDAFSALHRARLTALVISCLGLLGIMIAAVVLSDQIVRRIQDADRQKEMMNEQVIEAGRLASIGELAAGIAHEINNPVAIMVEEAGWIDDLLEEEDVKGNTNFSELHRAVQQIKAQGKRCKEVTHKLLSFARKTDPAVVRVQLNDLVGEVVALCQQRARYDNVHIVQHLQADLPEIAVARSEIQQVLLNLINNSLDSMESKGGVVEIGTRQENCRLVIDVSDQGCGIPPANLQRIFDPFFTTKPVGKGTGLGLSICYGIVKKMGGEISVNSAVGVGTAFHIKIPVQCAEHA